MMNNKNDSASRGLFGSRVALALALLIGCAAGFILRGQIQKAPNHGIIEIRQGGWNYINPLLECEQAPPILQDSELKDFEHRVNDFVVKDLKKKWGDEVSVYFRELNDGLQFDIGKEDFFYPASLIKVPMMISILKQAETNPHLLKTTIAFNDSKLSAGQNPEVPDKLVLGRSYTVDDLLSRMIKYSDNVSYDLLLMKVADRAVLEKTYSDLGFPPPYHSGVQTQYVLSTEQYSSCFRMLYNASYLTKPMSEKALEYLSKSDFKFGLVASLPANIVVAHKFGFWAENGVRLLHDCGIVYYPNNPYLLCVMTSAPDKEGYDPTISELSRFIYQEVDRQRGLL
jgi:beta-lactamase class A